MPAVTLVQFAAAAVISYLGLLAGFFLASVTKEELPTARKYFPWLQKLVILATAAVVMSFLNVAPAIKIAAYAFLLLLISVKLNLRLFYSLFGLAVFSVSKDANALLAVSSLVFLFGLVSGSAYFGIAVKRKGIAAMRAEAVKLFVSNLSYIAISLALFLIFFYL